MDIRIVSRCAVVVPRFFDRYVTVWNVFAVFDEREAIGQVPTVCETPSLEQAGITANRSYLSELSHVNLKPGLPVVHREWLWTTRFVKARGIAMQVNLVKIVF